MDFHVVRYFFFASLTRFHLSNNVYGDTFMSMNIEYAYYFVFFIQTSKS